MQLKTRIGDCHRLPKPGGSRLVGHAESLTGLTGGFTCVRLSIHMKQPK